MAKLGAETRPPLLQKSPPAPMSPLRRWAVGASVMPQSSPRGAGTQTLGRCQSDWPSTQPSPALPPEWTAIVLRTESRSVGRDSKTPNLSAPTTSRAPQNRRVFLATFAAVLGNFSFGYALVYTSPVIPALEHSLDPNLRLTKTQASWFGVRTRL